MQDKLIFEKKKRKYVANGSSVGISPKNYNKICDICYETGMKQMDVVNKLVCFAFKHMEIVDTTAEREEMGESDGQEDTDVSMP